MSECTQGKTTKVHLVLSVLQNLVIGLLVLLDSFLQLDAVDLDAELWMREVSYKVEDVVIIHLLALQPPHATSHHCQQ